MDVSIIGYGTVGRSLACVFPGAQIIDPAQGHDGRITGGIAFVCVPTPMAPDGSCDTSIVREVVTSHAAELYVLRSTVPPGTCRSLGVPIVFQPEYLGMTPGHRYESDLDVPFVILGGEPWQTRKVAKLYRTVLPPDTSYHHTDLETAELVKYAVNTFLATKVEFANELHDACAKLGSCGTKPLCTKQNEDLVAYAAAVQAQRRNRMLLAAGVVAVGGIWWFSRKRK